MEYIAYITNDYTDRFGIPRQSGLAAVRSKIVFLPEYRNPDALRGIECYTHLWLLWHFDLDRPEGTWSPTVRPPKLGGNRRMGVFATRSPNRPNPIGLSSVRLVSVEKDGENGMVLYVEGADLQSGTMLYDIKPYLPYTDIHPDAADGFAVTGDEGRLAVDFPEGLLAIIPQEKRAPLYDILSQDPRPGYQHTSGRVYHMPYGTWEIDFTVCENTLTVTDVRYAEGGDEIE